MNTWKILGLAGLVGAVGVTGATVIRRRRSWDDIEPDELRERLHERLRAARARS